MTRITETAEYFQWLFWLSRFNRAPKYYEQKSLLGLPFANYYTIIFQDDTTVVDLCVRPTLPTFELTSNLLNATRKRVCIIPVYAVFPLINMHVSTRSYTFVCRISSNKRACIESCKTVLIHACLLEEIRHTQV